MSPRPIRRRASRLALCTFLLGSAGMAGSALAAPVAAPSAIPVPPVPPVPPAPPAPRSPLPPVETRTAAATLVIPETCLDHLTVTGGTDARIVAGHGTLDMQEDRLTFTTSAQNCAAQDSAVLMVPAQTNIKIQPPHSHATAYRVSGISGDITATSGSGDLDIDQANSLTLNMEGDGNVSVGLVTGRLAVQSFASGDLDIGNLATSSASFISMSSGDIDVRQGNTDVLTVRDYGSSDIELNATARDADVTLLGSGDITIKKVSEALRKRPLGSGTLSVGETSGARVTTTSAPDGSAILSDATQKILGRLHVQIDNPEAASAASSQTHSRGGSHHSGGHGLIGLLLKIALIVWAVRLFRRYRRTGVLPFRATLDKAAAGYAEGVRSWSQHRAAWRETPAASASAVVKDVLSGFRQPSEPTEDFSRSVPPGHPLARLQDRLARMERRLGLMEQFVTSPNFSLERQFRDLERTNGRRA